MELQLGLSLPFDSAKGFDLNACFHEPPIVDDSSPKKRGFDVAFDQTFAADGVPRTLPLLLWNNQPNNDDDDFRDSDHNLSSDIIKDDGEEDNLVGWPPIKYANNKRQSPNNRAMRNDSGEGAGSGGGAGAGGVNTMYVKVNMEGMGIARKVDLSLYDSHQTLIETLLGMFGKGEEENSNGYRLAYQDREGDWLLAQDIPWRYNFSR